MSCQNIIKKKKVIPEVSWGEFSFPPDEVNTLSETSQYFDKNREKKIILIKTEKINK